LKEKEYDVIKKYSSSLDDKVRQDILHIEIMKNFKFDKDVKEMIWETDEELKR